MNDICKERSFFSKLSLWGVLFSQRRCFRVFLLHLLGWVLICKAGVKQKKPEAMIYHEVPIKHEDSSRIISEKQNVWLFKTKQYGFDLSLPLVYPNIYYEW